jgi:putative ABC transport system permease protein
MVNLRPFQVVGVMPPGFGFPGAADVWIPPFSDRQLTGQAFGPEVVARLRPGVTPRAAEEALARFDRERGASEPETDAERMTLAPLHAELTARVRPLVLLLAAGVGLLLLVSCSNVAGLLLSRVARRQPEFVLRRALGGSRWRLTRLLMVESLVLSTAAGLLGAAGAAVILQTIPRLIDQPIPGVDLAALDGRLLLVALLVSVGTGLAFGLAPGLAAGAYPAAEVMRSSTTVTTSRVWRWFRSSLVVSQVALALALLAISAASVRTATRLADVELGFGNDRAVSLELALPLERYAAPDQIMAFYRDASERLGAVPGVVRVGATGMLPGERTLGVGLALNPAGAGPDNRLGATMLFASPGYFEAMGVSLLQGRPFLPSDSTGSPRVIILSESAVRELWPDGRSAVGQRVEISNPPVPVEYEVIGVAADVLLRGPEATGNRRQFYRSILQSPPYGNIAFVVEAATPLEDLVPGLRSALAEVDPALPMYNVQPVEVISARFLAPHRIAMALMGSFAVMTLLHSAIGLYGVHAQVVAQRTREIGIRMALGADGGRVIRSVVLHGLRLAALGVVLGAAAAGLAASLIGSFLPSLDTPDGMTIVLNAGVLLAVAAAATWLPARRAATVDPLRALRE